MKTKTYLIIGAVLAALVIGYFVFKGKPKTLTEKPLGYKKSGGAYYQKDVDEIAKYIKSDKGWYDKINNSLPEGLSIEQALIDNALYTLANYK